MHFSETSTTLLIARERKIEKKTKNYISMSQTVKIELATIGAFTLVIGGITVYVTKADFLTTLFMMSGTLIIGSIVIIVTNWDNIKKRLNPATVVMDTII